MPTTAAFPRTVVAGAASAVPTESLLDTDRLDVYAVALEFQLLVPRLLPRRGYAALRDQLDRASASIALNIADASY